MGEKLMKQLVLSALFVLLLAGCAQRMPMAMNVADPSNFGGDCASTPAPFHCKQ